MICAVIELSCFIKNKIIMEKFKEFMKNFWHYRYWINAIGWAIALGFLNNCVLWAYFPIGQVEWSMLLSVLAVMLGVSGARDIGLGRNHDAFEENENLPDGQKVIRRRWITATGWFLALGFVNNCVVAPYYSSLRLIDWWQLLTALGIMLGISGTRDVIFYKFQQKIGEISEGLIQTKEKDDGKVQELEHFEI